MFQEEKSILFDSEKLAFKISKRFKNFKGRQKNIKNVQKTYNAQHSAIFRNANNYSNADSRRY